MKLKRITAALLSGVMALGMLSGLGVSENGSRIQSVLDTLSLDAEQITASAAGTMRRPLSNEQPMLIVHIDTWNVADPAKIIALIPENLKPYVVFNISLSIYWNNHQWGMVQNGYECAKSWLRTCSDEGVWTMIQPASGGQCHFPDYDASNNIVQFPNKSLFASNGGTDLSNTIYDEFFRDYPSFLGFNYSEQFWGFESADFPVTPIQRYEHFARLLKLCNKYGGYLNINWCANQWSAPLNPIAMLKRCTSWREACEKYSENFILEEKYTQGSFIEDVESEVLGAYLSGYCGNFGVRYDETGWTDANSSGGMLTSKDQYRQITGLPIHLERMVLNGATVIDGPELIWADDFRELGRSNDSEGYSCRGWDTRDQYENATLDFFDKVVDGTIRIPSRQEVIDRTKVIILQDNTSGDDHNKYSTYASLFEGLYRMNGDGNLRDNHNLFKQTGRYPTIPTAYALRDDVAKSFDVQIKQSSIPSRWSSISAKQTELNKLFPQEYTGSCYAGRYENSWVTYNNNKTGATAGGTLDLKYNTCKQLEVSFSAYGNALINEYGDHIDIYANNFDNKAQTTLKTDTFKITGCKQQPTFTYKDTGRNQTKSQVSESYSGGTYTLTVQHNGPLSISIKCSGNETGRLTNYKTAKLVEPAAPSFYEGTRQYEGEFFDTKSVEGVVANACGSGVSNVLGQGFLKFGKNANAAAKDTVRTTKAGSFSLSLRYSATADINNVDLYVNGTKSATLSLPKGSNMSDWKTAKQTINLKAGDNKIEFKATSALASSLYIDCFMVDGDFGEGAPVVIEPINGKLIKNLVVSDKENAADWSIEYGIKNGFVLFGDRDVTATSVPSNLASAEVIKTACDSKLVTTDLGSFTAGADITVYVAMDTRMTANLPAWLKSWTKTSATISTSNDLTLEIFRKDVTNGTSVTLGTNGGSNEAVNYIVLATPKSAAVKGDINGDGVINIIDVSIAKQIVLKKQTNDAADVNLDGKADVEDVKLLKAFVHGKITSFPQKQPEIVVTEPEDNFNYNANLQYKAAPASYNTDCAQKGTVEKVTYTTTVYSNALTKAANVYLPYGYNANDKTKKYNVFYLMHGGGGNENSIFLESTIMKKYLDSMIMNGDIEPMIVVTPTYNNAAGSDMTSNSKNFYNELAKDVIPAIEGKYNTYAKSTSDADLKAAREHRAFGGFSMGGLTVWCVFLHDLDYFKYFMPLSGDCWEGNTAEAKATALENAIKASGYSKEDYVILAATGNKDIAYSALSQQVDAMKKLTNSFVYTSDFSKGNFYFLTCAEGSHWWDGYIVNYIYDGLPYFFH